MPEFIDETGNTYGRLKVVSKADPYWNSIVWLCHCSCGGVARVTGYALRGGRSKSCGCLRAEKNSQRHAAMGLGKIGANARWAAST